ncbi:hypothetical protein QQS21_005964 [Conoideocrella luteorostrata]|uniref:Uncharacterized protein n=1 Tax=Conoideocrella luteorostrata TaxID=1105319 RepID=A0AAJ0CNR8_9HYPO|nr:hypothetical protein QQS21_005964 [Conoideocrella luteorostrata]
MEKVWFKLRQADYPPPTPESMGTGTETAPISLGHFIASLNTMDVVLNRGSIEPFPNSMPVYTTKATNFKWDMARERRAGTGAGTGAPVAAVAGATLKATVQVAFQQSVQGCEEYERLDTYIVQPTAPYVEDSLERAELAAYVSGKLTWSVFMITGIKVARKGKRTVTEEARRGVDGKAIACLPPVANLKKDVTLSRHNTHKMDGSDMSDFVWAVRLHKISGHVLTKNWTMKPYTERATFANNKEEVDIYSTIEAEGLINFAIVVDQELDEVVILKLDE